MQVTSNVRHHKPTPPRFSLPSSFVSSLPKNAFALGALLSLVSVTVAGAVGAALYATLGGEGVGPSAAEALLSAREPWLFLAAVLLVPTVETLVGQLAPIELLRRLKAPTALSVAVSALVFGLGHYVNGGLGHGLTSFAAGVVFAIAYLASRARSVPQAFACACCCHASHNFLFLYLIAPVATILSAPGDA